MKQAPEIKLSPNQKGDWAELSVAARFMALGWSVSKPLSNGLPYDFILDRGSGLVRVQVKGARIRDNKVKWNPYKGRVHGSSVYTDVHADLCALFCFDNGKIYMIPIDLMFKGFKGLRLEQNKKRDALLAGSFEI